MKSFLDFFTSVRNCKELQLNGIDLDHENYFSDDLECGESIVRCIIAFGWSAIAWLHPSCGSVDIDRFESIKDKFKLCMKLMRIFSRLGSL